MRRKRRRGGSPPSRRRARKVEGASDDIKDAQGANRENAQRSTAVSSSSQPSMATSLSPQQVYEVVIALRMSGQDELPLALLAKQIGAKTEQLLEGSAEMGYPWKVLETSERQMSAKLLPANEVDAILTMMRRSVQASQPFAPLYMQNPAVEEFLRQHPTVQEHAKTSLRTLPRELQDIVLSRGSMHFAQEQTTVLMARMRRARQGELTAFTGVSPGPNPSSGDWHCARCGALQSAGYISCRACRAPSPGFSQLSRVPGAESFVRQPGLHEHVIAAFATLSPEQQAGVLCRGTLAGARDVNAVLTRRMSTVKAGGCLGTGPTLYVAPGDWFCSQCNGHNFTGKRSCRNCGAGQPGLPPGA